VDEAGLYAGAVDAFVPDALDVGLVDPTETNRKLPSNAPRLTENCFSCCIHCGAFSVARWPVSSPALRAFWPAWPVRPVPPGFRGSAGVRGVGTSPMASALPPRSGTLHWWAGAHYGARKRVGGWSSVGEDIFIVRHGVHVVAPTKPVP